jgi:hypothetical protein
MPGVEKASIPDRIMSLLCLIVEARIWSYAWSEVSYPAAFVATLHSDRNLASQALNRAHKLWNIMVSVESSRNLYPGLWSLRQKVYWMTWPTTQLLFRLLAHESFVLKGSLLEHFRLFFTRIGDSKIIEDANKIARRTEHKENDNRCTKSQRVFHHIKLAGKNPIEQRKIDHVEVPKSDWGKAPPKTAWATLTNPTNHTLPPALGTNDTLKGTKPYPSKTPYSRRVSIGAFIAMELCCETSRAQVAGQCWQTCACSARILIREVSSGKFFCFSQHHRCHQSLASRSGSLDRSK